jgi:hypothetical protein
MTIRAMFGPGALVASLVALAACGGNGMDTAGKGRVAIVMSATGGALASVAADARPDGGAVATGASSASASSRSHDGCAPGQALQAAGVTFSSILARTLEGILTGVTIDLPVTVDMLSLANGQDATLPIGFLPPGTYDQIVVVMTKVEVTLQDGMKIAITPPGGGWTAVVPVAQPFTVVEGETTTITLKFRRDLSFGCGSGDWEFHPRFECDRRNDH